MNPHTLRDWARRFNSHSPFRPEDIPGKNQSPRPSLDPIATLAATVETGGETLCLAAEDGRGPG